jgi:large subunit ribosomal protein L15
MPSELNLSSLQPAQKRVARKRVGRGMGSGKGRYAGRGLKGQKSRSGSHKMRAGFEGGQMPLYMRLGKQPGATSKDAMPIGPFRTHTQGVNVRDLERVFDAGSEVTPEALKARRLIRTIRVDVKILGQGELTKQLVVSAHGFSQSAREKIEAAGGSAILLREPKLKKRKRGRKSGAETPAADAELQADEVSKDTGAPAEADETAADPEPDPEPEAKQE